MRHLNGNLLVAVGIRTDGNGPLDQFSDLDKTTVENGNLVQVCFIPLNSNIELDRKRRIFETFIQPRFKDPTRIQQKIVAGGKNYCEICQFGLEEGSAKFVFDNWFDKLELRDYKKIVPLAFNWPVTRAWLSTWLDERGMLTYFSNEYRDLLSVAMFHNDWCFMQDELYRFQKPLMPYITKSLSVPHDSSRKCAVEDATATAECYRRLCFKFLG